ncbi:hypothetical protein ACFLTP_10075 [Chloroflexota bacterium]
MSIGKLYRLRDNQFITGINYRVHNGSTTNWWGELTLIDFTSIIDGDGYLIELEDKRRGKCHLKKRVNRAVSGIPPRYVYHFSGNTPFK